MSKQANLELELLDAKEQLEKVTAERDELDTKVTYLENIINDTKSGNLQLVAELMEAQEEIKRLKGES